MYTLATKEAIYFLWRNLKLEADAEKIKAVWKYKEQKKKYKASESKDKSKKPKKPEFLNNDLKTKFEVKI
jgi:hypothetical protein